MPLPATNPTQFRVNLPAGEEIYREGLATIWLQGQISYSFALDVRAPAAPPTPTPARLTLTG